MARLRNRMVKAEFWTDPELLRWPRDKRETYRGLWAIAEDSACLEDDPFGWKLLLWPSPIDADITVELLETWRDEFMAVGKLIPYEADGKQYLYVKNFHQHEQPRNPQRPDLPLPAWVIWVVSEDSKGRSRRIYVVDNETLLSHHCDATVSPAPSSLVPSSLVPSSLVPSSLVPEARATTAPVDNLPEEDALVAFALLELPKSESTAEDYSRTITRYRLKLSDEHIERIIAQLGNYTPKKPHGPKLHLTLASWLNKEPRDALPQPRGMPPTLEPGVPMPAEVKATFQAMMGRGMT